MPKRGKLSSNQRKSHDSSSLVNGAQKRTSRNTPVNKSKTALVLKDKRSKPSTPKPSTSNEVNTIASSDDSDSDRQVCVPKQLKTVKHFAEQCILSNTKSKPHTSDRTLKDNKLDFTTLHSLLKSTTDSHPRERTHLLKEYKANVTKWLVLLQEGFNLMFFGVGSKLSIVDQFVQENLKEKNTVAIHGFFPGLSLKLVLNGITDDILNYQGSFSSLHSQAEFIVQNLNTDLYIIVHNIDSPVLSTEKSLVVLCHLAKSKKIHFVSTVDHVNSGLIWNSSRASCFRFLWFDLTTFLSYRMENAYENSFLLKQSNTLALSSLQHVFCSLTPNAQGIFMILAKAQLSQKGSQKNGLLFKDLFRLCREAFLVNSDLTLQTQLTEFRDHNMIRQRKGQDGLEYLQVAVDNESLQEFVNTQE